MYFKHSPPLRETSTKEPILLGISLNRVSDSLFKKRPIDVERRNVHSEYIENVKNPDTERPVHELPFIGAVLKSGASATLRTKYTPRTTPAGTFLLHYWPIDGRVLGIKLLLEDAGAYYIHEPDASQVR